VIGCISSYNVSGNIGKHGTSCPPFECVCISEASQPLSYAIKEVCCLSFWAFVINYIHFIFISWMTDLLYKDLILMLIIIRYNKLSDPRDNKLNVAESNSIEISSLVDMVCDKGSSLVWFIDYKLLTVPFSKCIFFWYSQRNCTYILISWGLYLKL